VHDLSCTEQLRTISFAQLTYRLRDRHPGPPERRERRGQYPPPYRGGDTAAAF